MRRAGEADRALVADLRLEFLAEERGDPSIAEDAELLAAVVDWLDETDGHGAVTWLAVEPSGRAVGLVTLILDRRPPRPGDQRTTVGYVVHLYVVPERRGQGIGRALFETLLDGARERSCRQVFLHATDDGLPLYAAAGFTQNDRFLDLPLAPPPSPPTAHLPPVGSSC